MDDYAIRKSQCMYECPLPGEKRTPYEAVFFTRCNFGNEYVTETRKIDADLAQTCDELLINAYYVHPIMSYCFFAPTARFFGSRTPVRHLQETSKEGQFVHMLALKVPYNANRIYKSWFKRNVWEGPSDYVKVEIYFPALDKKTLADIFAEAAICRLKFIGVMDRDESGGKLHAKTVAFFPDRKDEDEEDD